MGPAAGRACVEEHGDGTDTIGTAEGPSHGAGLAAGVALAALGAGAPSGAAAAASCNTALAGRTTQVAPGAGLTVALTFDDDRKEWMPAILNILRRNNIRATFFVTGQYASEMPTILQRAARDGQVLANHTWYHYYPSAANGYWSVPYLTSAITSTANLQQQTVGYRGCFFRPPGGFLNNVAAVTARRTWRPSCGTSTPRTGPSRATTASRRRTRSSASPRP